MNVTQAEYIRIDDHPFLRLIIDDKEALVGDFKWGILKLGYVPLHSRMEGVSWEKLLPEIHIPATEESDSIDLKGFTNDPLILKMAHSYWNAINQLEGEKFEEGPLSVPIRG